MSFSKTKLFLFLALTIAISNGCWAEEAVTKKSQCDMYGSYQDETEQWLTCESEPSNADINDADDYQYTNEPDEIDEYQHTEPTEQDYETEEEDERTNDSEY